MTLFESLLIAHILGDWIFQSEWMAVNKESRLQALIVHLVVYHAFVLVALGIHLGFGNSEIYLLTMLLMITHAVLDRRRALGWFMRVMSISVRREPERLLAVAVDQSLHILMLAALTIYISLGNDLPQLSLLGWLD